MDFRNFPDSHPYIPNSSSSDNNFSNSRSYIPNSSSSNAGSQRDEETFYSNRRKRPSKDVEKTSRLRSLDSGSLGTTNPNSTSSNAEEQRDEETLCSNKRKGPSMIAKKISQWQSLSDGSPEITSPAPIQIRHERALKPVPYLYDETKNEPPVFESIRKLLDSSPDYYSLSNASFTVYLETIHGDNGKLAPVLTFSGTAKKVYAATYEDYIEKFWPNMGLEVLTAIEQTIAVEEGQETPESSRLLKDLHIRVSSRGRDGMFFAFDLDADGSIYNLEKLAQILSWITAVSRFPKTGKLEYSTVLFSRYSWGKFEIRPSDLCPINSEDLCWCPMVAEGVIAKDFPTPKRNNDEVGLEIPFDIMILLGRIWYPMEYLDGFVLKGYSTILVPTSKTGDSVQWHFVHDRDENKKISMSEIQTHCESFVEDLDFSSLQTTRMFVGWTADAHVHAGAKTSGYASIVDSKASFSPRRPRLAKEITSGIGTSGLGFFGIQLGTKVVIPKNVLGPVQREHILLEDRLLNSKDNSSLIWDDSTRRGWMVSEIAALLMILHVWAARQTDSEAFLQRIPFVECSSNDAQASYEAIRANRDLQLRSHANGDGEDLPFLTLLKNILAIIESRKEEIITRDNDSASISADNYFKGGFSFKDYLRGWELTDIAHSKPWFREKRSVLDATCGTWPSVIEKKPEILVLFCKGVEELIQPVADETLCRTWKHVPKGHSYLAAIVPRLAKSDIHFHSNDPFRACRFDGQNCPSRLQGVDQKPSSTLAAVPQTGAIIAGKKYGGLCQPCSKDEQNNSGSARKIAIKEDPTQVPYYWIDLENNRKVSSRPKSQVCNPDTYDQNFDTYV